MDAANPLCRWLLAAGLIVAVGCQSNGKSGTLSARGQVPPDPLAPAGPLAPVAPGPLSPVGAGPLSPAAPTSADIQKTSYTALPTVGKAAEMLKDSIPQIRVVAHVGSANHVTDQEVVEAVRQRDFTGFEGHARRAKEKELYALELRRIIERELILDEMYTKLKKAGKLAAIDDIKGFAGTSADHAIRGMRKQAGLKTEEEFGGWLLAQGLTEAVIRRQIERQIMGDEYVRSLLKEKGRTPGLADVRGYFDRHPEDYKTDDNVKWLDIFISFNKHATPRAAYDHAEMIRAKAAAGDDFVGLVKQFDNGLAVGTNGVGLGSKRGEIKPADIEAAIWALRPGEVSAVLEAPAGYHVVKIAEREYAGPRIFDAKVQIEIREKLTDQYRKIEYQKFVDDLWRKGAVRIIE